LNLTHIKKTTMINKDPNHIHTYDAKGNMTCCSLEEKIDSKTGKPHSHPEGESNEHEHDSENDEVHDHVSETATWKAYLPAIISFVLLLTGLAFEHFIKPSFFQGYVKLIWYIFAYIPVGLPVMKDAVKSIAKGAFFSEYFLMSIATIGAFFIKEYAEGVTVMLFYAIGELFQTAAVNRAKRSIKALLDIRPDTVNVNRNGTIQTVAPFEIQIGDIIQVKAGEKVALDGELISETASFNTAALTGESKPDTQSKGEVVLAGLINFCF